MKEFKIFCIFLTFFVVSISGAPSSNEETCPNMCNCDLYMDMNRANCSSRRLIYANTNIADAVEILDLTNNDITVLDSQCFSDLKHLSTLLLDNNSIHTIDWDAFAKLRKLEHLSLANNRLELFDYRIIEKANKLISINLSGNKFMNLQDVPLLRSKSLQTIYLHNSQISHIFPNTFHDIPHLTSVDLSNNLMITLNIDVFKRSHNLKSLNLTGNPWNCDENFQNTLKRLKRRNVVVNIGIRECEERIKTTPRMFERMEMLPSLFNDSDPETSVANNIKLDRVWKILQNHSQIDQICPLNNSDKACDLFETCVANLHNVYKQIEMEQRRANEKAARRKLGPSMTSLQAALYVGLLFGSFLGGLIVYSLMVLYDRCRRKSNENPRLRRTNAIRERNRNRAQSDVSSTLTTESEIIELPPPSHQTPPVPATRQTPPAPPARRRVHRHRQQPQQHQQIVRQQSFSFLDSLFGRPVRRRYLRSMNQNATNLVRRLSQSRLFLNRSNSSNPTTTVETPSAPVHLITDTTQLLDHGSDSHNRNSVVIYNGDECNESLVAHETHEVQRVCNEDILITDRRSETPPPAYKDVVETKSI